MRRDLLSSVLAIVAITLVFGLAYPLVVTGISQLAFHGRANGSLIHQDGKVVGSTPARAGLPQARARCGRQAQDRQRRQPRPGARSALLPAASLDRHQLRRGGHGVHQPRAELQGRPRHVQGQPRRASWALEGRYYRGLTAARVPVDAVTSSASGIDPQISKANAAIQAHRIAAVRRLPLARVQQLVADHTDGRSLGVLGEPGVNVLELNLALDHLSA